MDVLANGDVTKYKEIRQCYLVDVFDVIINKVKRI